MLRSGGRFALLRRLTREPKPAHFLQNVTQNRTCLDAKKIFYYTALVTGVEAEMPRPEIIPAEYRTVFQPDPDNAGGGRL